MISILLAILAYVAVIILSTIAARALDSTLVAAITNFVSAIIPTLLILPILNGKTLANAKFGILISILAGVAVAVFAIFLNKSLSTDKVAIVTPLIFGGTIFLSTLVSFFLFKEKITFIQGVGLLFLGIGFSLIIYAKNTAK